MFGVGFGEEFDAEVVYSEGEGRGTVVVPPEAWGVSDGVVTVGCQVGTELFVGEDGGFLEAIHAFSNFHVAVTLSIEIISC